MSFSCLPIQLECVPTLEIILNFLCCMGNLIFHESEFWNPACPGMRRLFFSRSHLIGLLTSLYRSLSKQLGNVMGLNLFRQLFSFPGFEIGIMASSFQILGTMPSFQLVIKSFSKHFFALALRFIMSSFILLLGPEEFLNFCMSIGFMSSVSLNCGSSALPFFGEFFRVFFKLLLYDSRPCLVDLQVSNSIQMLHKVSSKISRQQLAFFFLY